MYRFQAFNRQISSPLYFPELLTSDQLTQPTDIQITFGNVSQNGIEEPLKSGVFFQTNKKYFWLHVPKIATFLVSDGKHILIDPDKNVDESSLRIFILESCFKALLSQQKFIILEGCAIKIGEHAVLFVMPPSFGKSTFCSFFLKKGYSILSDEICAICDDLHLHPSYPSIHLWLNIAQQLNIDASSLKPTRSLVKKYRLNIDKKFHGNTLPIKLIYAVNYHKEKTLLLNKMGNIEKLFLPPHIIQQSNLNQLAHHIPMINLTLPRWDYSMNQLGYLLEKVFDSIQKDIMNRIEHHECI